jgi:hypothetical protein
MQDEAPLDIGEFDHFSFFEMNQSAPRVNSLSIPEVELLAPRGVGPRRAGPHLDSAISPSPINSWLAKFSIRIAILSRNPKLRAIYLTGSQPRPGMYSRLPDELRHATAPPKINAHNTTINHCFMRRS